MFIHNLIYVILRPERMSVVVFMLISRRRRRPLTAREAADVTSADRSARNNDSVSRAERSGPRVVAQGALFRYSVATPSGRSEPQSGLRDPDHPDELDHGFIALTAAEAATVDLITMGADGVADLVAAAAPGAGLAVLLERVATASLSVYGQVEVVAAARRLESWSAARAASAAADLSQHPELARNSLLAPNDRHVSTERAADLLRPRLGVTRHAARRLVGNGRAFAAELFLTGDALAVGLIDYAKADLIHRHLERRALDVTIPAERIVLPRAPHRTSRQIEGDLARALIAVSPEDAEIRSRRARCARRVNHPRALPDGLAAITAVMPAPDAVALDLCLESAARSAKHHGDRRTLDQLRADALALMAHHALDSGVIGGSSGGGDPSARPTDLGGAAGAPWYPSEPGLRPSTAASRDAALPSDHRTPAPGEQCAHSRTCVPPRPGDDLGAARGSSTPGPAPRRVLDAPPAPGEYRRGRPSAVRLGTIGGGRTRVHVTVPLRALLPAEPGAEPDPDISGGGLDAAVLDGYGPITDDVARALALGGVWQRLVTDPVNHGVLDVGRTRYQPPAALAEHVRHRDRTCVVPACSVPARSCDIDHMTPWEGGGHTAVDNLQLLCPGHHLAKTAGDFVSQRRPDGSYVFVTTLSGDRYERRADGDVRRLTPLSPAEISALTLPEAPVPVADRPGPAPPF